MLQIIEATQEKIFIPINNPELWAGLSYRNSFNSLEIQSLNSLTPF